MANKLIGTYAKNCKPFFFCSFGNRFFLELDVSAEFQKIQKFVSQQIWTSGKKALML